MTIRRVVLWILLFVAVSAIASFVMSALKPGRSAANTPALFAVEYIIEGTAAKADLTYQNATGSTEQTSAVRLPFSLKFNAVDGQFLYISAQNATRLGSVVCRILLDGVEQKSATSTGAYTIATCSGRFTH